eukprot:418757-Alexandrium_andersonii.AAC.1
MVLAYWITPRLATAVIVRALLVRVQNSHAGGSIMNSEHCSERLQGRWALWPKLANWPQT